MSYHIDQSYVWFLWHETIQNISTALNKLSAFHRLASLVLVLTFMLVGEEVLSCKSSISKD